MNIIPERFKNIRDCIPLSLISEEWFSQICTIANHFPLWMSSSYWFELYLNKKQNKGDFFIDVDEKNLASLNALDCNEKNSTGSLKKRIPGLLSDSPGWEWLKEFCTLWSESNLTAFKKIQRLYLEFDTSSEKADFPIPSLFITGHNEDNGNTFKYELDTFIDFFERFSHDTFTNIDRQYLNNILKELPEKSRLFSIGFMFPRKPNEFRICILHDSLEEIYAFLRKNNAEECIQAFIPVIQLLPSSFINYIIQINLNNPSNPVTGLECCYNLYSHQHERKLKWEPVMEALVKNNLCPEKTAEDLIECHRAERNMYRPYFLKTITTCFISHIKLVYKPDVPLLLKAYLQLKNIPL